jgi:hypothetical protein
LAASFPLHVVCKWIGNSAAIAQTHYLQVTDADIEKAALGIKESGERSGAESGAVDREAVQNLVQPVSDSERQDLTQPPSPK